MAINIRNQVQMLVSKKHNIERLVSTLEYIIKLITSELGYLELSRDIAQSKIVEPLQSTIVKFYADIQPNRVYKDVDSLVNGCLDRPYYRNDEFQSSVTKIKIAAKNHFNALATKDNPEMIARNSSVSATSKTDGSGVIVLGPSESPQVKAAVIAQAKSNSKKTSPQPVVVKNDSKVNEIISMIPSKQMEIVAPTSSVSAPSLVQADTFSQMVSNVNEDVSKAALTGASGYKKNGLDVSQDQLAMYTSADGESFDVDSFYKEEYPLLDWFLQSQGIVASEIKSSSVDQSQDKRSSFQKILTVPQDLLKSLTSGL